MRSADPLAERLAMVALHAAAICHLDTVVVTGRPIATLPALVEHAARTVNTLARSADEPRLRLQRGSLGGRAPLTGACHLASSIAATGLMQLTGASRALPDPRAAIVVVRSTSVTSVRHATAHVPGSSR